MAPIGVGEEDDAVPEPAQSVAAPHSGDGGANRGRARRRLPDGFWFLIVFVLAMAIFSATAPGRMIFDTKLGVDIRAGDFLSRLWSLWNPLEWFGSLNDQYVGYAIPMAPFFLAGQFLHVPIWLIERAWLSLLVAVGFTGMVKLARELQIGSDASRLAAGAVFALWPTFTIELGSTSAGALPGVIVPWAMLPLISAVRGRTPTGRSAARSGIAVALMAGVNATSTLAVLLLPALFICMRSRGRLRVRLGLQWCAAVVAATAWWVIPLLLQGKYSFNFLPYIEQSATTARTMSAASALRGAGNWTAYLKLNGTPWDTAGWTLVTSAAAILATAVASAAGLAGLARRDMPERRWLCCCVGLVAAIGLAGYYGPLGSPFSAGTDRLLDGALAPLRSTYKLEPVIAVALALGCAHLLHRCWRMKVRLTPARKLGLGVISAPAVALVLAGMALPQISGRALQPGSFAAVPSYWSQAAAYLARHSPRNAALVVPANPHGQFTWGDTIDDPLEPLASSPWVERALAPLGGTGSQVLLTTAEQAIESDQQVPGLAAYLARAGIRFVLVRNDTNPAVSGYVPPQVVNETLVLSGFRRVAGFGPSVAATAGYPNAAGQVPGFASSYPAVEIFAASSGPQTTSPVSTLPVGQTVLVNGGPDSLLQLSGQGVITTGQPTVIAGQQLPARPSLWAVTDGQRRADTDFGSTQYYQSYTYAAGQRNPPDDPLGDAGGEPRQLLPVTAAGHQTVALLSGAASVTASSSGTWFGESAQYAPANAFDGSPATAWTESDPDTPVGQWLQVDFGGKRDLPRTARIELLDDSTARAFATQLVVTTSAGRAVTNTVATGAAQPINLPAGPSSWLRITITAASNVRSGYPGAGITDVLIPGIRVTTYLQPAEDEAGASAPTVAYSFSQPAPSAEQLAVGYSAADINRAFVTPSATRVSGELTAVPTPGPALGALIARLTPVAKSEFSVTASSTWNNLPAFDPVSLFRSTARLPWLASSADSEPTLTLHWRGRRTISSLVLKPSALAATPAGVLIGSPAGSRLAGIGPGGVVRIRPALKTDRLTLTISFAPTPTSDGASQQIRVPGGLVRISIRGLAGLHVAAPDSAARFRLVCGAGPAVSIDGRVYATSVTGTIADLLQLLPVRAHVCSHGAIGLAAGQHKLTAAPSADFAVSGVTLTGARSGSHGAKARPASARPAEVLTWGADNRSVRVGAGPASYLEVHENFNLGWRATLDGKPLRAATLDGWQQAFVVPAGSGGVVVLTYSPASVYHGGLIASGIALLLLAAIAAGLRLRRKPRAGRAESPARVSLREAPEPADAVASRHAGRPSRVPGGGRARYWLSLLALGAVIFVAGGPVVLIVPVLAYAGHRWRRCLPLIAGVAMVSAGIVAATASTPTALGSGTFSGAAQFCALAALAAALMPASGQRDRRQSRSAAQPEARPEVRL
jgi:arabinofuranan 3-O-arabinosyltransferase